MTLKETLDSIIDKPIQVEINNSKLFPFGLGSQFDRKPFKVTLKQHSINYYMVLLNEDCVLIFGIGEIDKFTVSYEDGEVFDIKWNGYRIVNLLNV